MKLTRKSPILFRFARHSGPLGKQRGERSQRNIVPGRPKNALFVQKMMGVVVGGNSPTTEPIRKPSTRQNTPRTRLTALSS
jgi:hypothetical protein